MIVVFSFCQSDYKMALELSRHVEALGGVRSHRCLLIHPDDVDGWEIEFSLRKVFGQFDSLIYKETLKGWPDGPNQCFAIAARQMCMTGTEPWLWMEPDCVPTRSAWLDDIETEYRYCGSPLLGCLEDTYGPDGKVCGKHVNGVAVYPGDWWKQCPLLSTMESATDAYRRTNNLPPAFDCYMNAYSTPRCTVSKTIKNMWKSHGFTEENRVVRCKYRQEYGASPIVDMRAALIHGCKDFSLLTIAQNRLLV